ncbi:hook-length control protein FliK [Halomonas shengliensis]|uniref:Hook-length control protein FliK n=1 Tax=Halomonas shengliensis TaxID=419597 RepID=A0A1H0F0U5_9GAMM|nr:flagellar hook-length control protein FliK [Halomonas shengliensis]SDN88166.1 hook-length control protein FliK [Halomonas shengliensis]
MSGIAPLLDTLLHQVLGKRVDTPPPQDLNQPVKPTSPADAPRALHSDSRLDARPGTAQAQGTRRAAAQVGEGATPAPRQEGAPPSSSQTHLSSAGRTIADLLMRFPAPPSILTTRTPLVPAGQVADPAQVATRLESSVRDSGLFYESHLGRWYKGELPRQQLEREPQMWRTLRFSPQAATAATFSQQDTRLMAPTDMRSHPAASGQAQAAPSATPSPGASPSATPQPLSSSTTPLAPNTAPLSSGDTPQQARATANEAMALRPPALTLQEPVHESLQGVVRHQLEMLVTPTLRWEGDVWSGLFMALLVQPPVGERLPREGDQEEPAGEDARRTWRSDIDLEVQGAGRVTASLWMQAARLEIDMWVADPDALARLQEGLDALRSRLGAHGFEEVGVTLGRLTAEGDDADP